MRYEKSIRPDDRGLEVVVGINNVTVGYSIKARDAAEIAICFSVHKKNSGS